MASDDPIAQVLQAATHYQVLGVDDDKADLATLRKAYLRRSVRVHPDKNDVADHPRATFAFQRVALAWQVLSNAEDRMEYDASLRNKQNYDDSRDNGPYQPGESPRESYRNATPSFADAMFLFATMTSMMGGNKSKSGSDTTTTSVMGDVAESLYWAEKLVQQQQQSQDRDRSGSATTNHNNKTMRQQATAAMAVGSSLGAVAATAKRFGFKGAAIDSVERTAKMTKVVGMSAMAVDAVAKESPAVQRMLEKSGPQLEKLRGSISAVRVMLQQQRDGAASK